MKNLSDFRCDKLKHSLNLKQWWYLCSLVVTFSGRIALPALVWQRDFSTPILVTSYKLDHIQKNIAEIRLKMGEIQNVLRSNEVWCLLIKEYQSWVHGEGQTFFYVGSWGCCQARTLSLFFCKNNEHPSHPTHLKLSWIEQNNFLKDCSE